MTNIYDFKFIKGNTNASNSSTSLPKKNNSRKKEKPAALIPIPEMELEKLNNLINTFNFIPRGKKYGEINSLYPFRDLKGNLIYIRIKFVNCPNGKLKQVIPFYFTKSGSWFVGEPPIDKLPLYGSENIMKYPEKKIVGVGEEECADIAQAASDKYVFITFGGGVSGIDKHELSMLNDREFIYCRDANPPGFKAIKKIINLFPKAEILNIQDKIDGWGVVDLIQEGGNIDEFIQQCPRIVFQDRIDPETSLPIINITVEDLSVITSQAWAAITAQNKPPALLNYAGRAIRLDVDEKFNVSIVYLDVDRLRFVAARSARWEITKKRNDEFYTFLQYPPQIIMRDMLACPEIPLPRLTRIVYAPVFSREGEIETHSGYHEKSKTYYQKNNIAIKEIPINPTRQEVERSIALFDDMTCDFPFVGSSDRAHAFALYLLPFSRDLIDGPTPMHLLRSSTPGIGKGLLADCCLNPGTDGRHSILAPAKEDDEWRKRLTAGIAEAKSAIIIDNVNTLQSPSLAAILTLETWTDRILGKNTEFISLPVRCVWVVTANNPVLTTELSRRSIPIRIESQQDRPWMREGFRHPNLRIWIKEHRAELIEAALIIIQSWISAGKPKPHVNLLGSFEEWSYVMGGILHNANIGGFLGNVIELYESADLEGVAWRTLVLEWWEKIKNKPVKTNELYKIAQSIEGFDLRGDTDDAQKKSFGMKLSKQRDRIYGDYRLIYGGTSHKVSLWRLEKINSSG